MNRPKLLDLFCGAGGASIGYHIAGFDVVGVDINQQPNYPFEFYRGDALTFQTRGFDVVHASPPCQVHSRLSHLASRHHLDLIPQTRDKLQKNGSAYIIENVVGAPLLNPKMLCGTMFGLRTHCGAQLIRHRIFESNITIDDPPACNHARGRRTISVFGDKARDTALEKRHYTKPKQTRGQAPKNILFSRKAASSAMGILSFMTFKELSQAIPPAYTEFIGKQLIRHIRNKSA